MRPFCQTTAACFAALGLTVAIAGANRFSHRDDAFQSWQFEDLVAQQVESGRPYLPFLNVSTMHCGIYVLAAGAEDNQQPHDEDEVYYVESGRAKFRVGDEDVDVGPGSILFVPAHLPHRFHDIGVDLRLVVFFSKADGEGDDRPN